MTDNLTPPPELVQEWIQKATGPDYEQRIAAQAARWAADQELEACCEILRGEFNYHHLAEPLRAARRPKQPSLKEQALRHVDIIQDNWAFLGDGEHASPSLTGQITYKQLQDIRSALEQLPEGPAVTPPAAAPDRPLWKAMHAAYCAAVGMGVSSYAAELRVVAAELERRQLADYSGVLPDVRGVLEWLRTEAARAEAGE